MLKRRKDDVGRMEMSPGVNWTQESRNYVGMPGTRRSMVYGAAQAVYARAVDHLVKRAALSRARRRDHLINRPYLSAR